MFHKNPVLPISDWLVNWLANRFNSIVFFSWLFSCQFWPNIAKFWSKSVIFKTFLFCDFVDICNRFPQLPWGTTYTDVMDVPGQKRRPTSRTKYICPGHHTGTKTNVQVHRTWFHSIFDQYRRFSLTNPRYMIFSELWPKWWPIVALSSTKQCVLLDRTKTMCPG